MYYLRDYSIEGYCSILGIRKGFAAQVGLGRRLIVEMGMFGERMSKILIRSEG